jgi:hypothetical protein
MRRFVFVVGILLALAGAALAQPVFRTYSSLELRALRAKAIFRGVVDSAEGTFFERPGGFFGGRRPDGTIRPDGVMRYAVTVHVLERLKGATPERVVFSTETSADDRRFASWAAQRTEFLFLVEDGAVSNLRGVLGVAKLSTIRLGKPVPEESGYTSDDPVILTDGTVVEGRERILREVQQALRLPASAETHTLPYWVSPWSSLQVPITKRLEQTARKMIAAPDEFAPPAMAGNVRASTRTAGVAALAHFRSGDNIRRLKGLLNDRDFILVAGRNGTKVQSYPVRAEAYKALVAWGIKVERPVLEEFPDWRTDG